MPCPVHYFLTDIDGDVFVSCRTSDWNEPRYVINHWRTPYRTFRILRDICGGACATLAEITLVSEIPGSFRITHIAGRPVYGNHLAFTLPEGGRQKSEHVTFAPVPRPRVGKGTRLEWCDGSWHKWTESKGHERIYV